jgi:hypothetical protein
MQTLFTLYKTSYLDEEVDYTEPAPSVGIPCLIHRQGNLTEGEGSVHLASIVLTSLDRLLLIMQTLFTLYKASYHEEVNRTEPSPSVSVS